MGYFTRAPFNYELFSKRIAKFKNQYRRHTPPKPHVYDLIAASRRLETASLHHHPHQAQPIEPRQHRLAFLEIETLPTKLVIEDTLWRLLNKYRLFFSALITKRYLVEHPRPTDTQRIFEAVLTNFDYHVDKAARPGAVAAVDLSPMYTALNQLLAHHDYHNSFYLVDRTVASPRFVQLQHIRVVHGAAQLFGALAVVVGFQAWELTQVPLMVWVGLDAVLAAPIAYYWFRMWSVPLVGRVSWRNLNLVLRNYVHRHELLAINKILVHYEEHHEVNISNYHTSQVRTHQAQEVHEVHVEDNLPQVLDANPPVLRLFRSEVYRRRMVINDVPQELMFVEFWLNHGEGFEWVEPDQDPSELIKFKISTEKGVVKKDG